MASNIIKKTFVINSLGCLSGQPPRLIKEKYSGYVARIFQHEIDHLNGILFIEHIKDPNKLHSVKDEEFPLYRNKQAWKTWPRKAY